MPATTGAPRPQCSSTKVRECHRWRIDSRHPRRDCPAASRPAMLCGMTSQAAAVFRPSRPHRRPLRAGDEPLVELEPRGPRRSSACIDDALWHLTRHNPLELLCRVDPARLAACASDSDFLRRYDDVMARMRARDLERATPGSRKAHPELDGRPVAYFCAEFGLHNSVPIYSGGLGVLAGDHCKASSDLGVPMVGVGLFYMKGYFDQRLRLDGWQEDSDEEFDVTLTPLVPVTGPKPAAVPHHGGDLGPAGPRAGLADDGRPGAALPARHQPRGRTIPTTADLMNKLYAGGPDLRLRQEWILGVGGVRVLRAMGIDPSVWHANEGHAAFMMVERLRELTSPGRSPRRSGPAGCARRACSPPIRRSPRATTPSRSSSSRRAPARSGRRWASTARRFFQLGAHPDLPGQFHMTVLRHAALGRG